MAKIKEVETTSSTIKVRVIELASSYKASRDAYWYIGTQTNDLQCKNDSDPATIGGGVTEGGDYTFTGLSPDTIYYIKCKIQFSGKDEPDVWLPSSNPYSVFQSQTEKSSTTPPAETETFNFYVTYPYNGDKKKAMPFISGFKKSGHKVYFELYKGDQYEASSQTYTTQGPGTVSMGNEGAFTLGPGNYTIYGYVDNVEIGSRSIVSQVTYTAPDYFYFTGISQGAFITNLKASEWNSFTSRISETIKYYNDKRGGNLHFSSCTRATKNMTITADIINEGVDNLSVLTNALYRSTCNAAVTGNVIKASYIISLQNTLNDCIDDI